MIEDRNEQKNNSQIDNGHIKTEQVEVNVNYLSPGIVLSGEIFNDNGEFLYSQNTLITKDILKNLHARGIEKIYFTPKEEEKIDPFKDKIKEVVDKFSESFKKNMQIDTNEIKQLMSDLYSQITKNNKFIFLMKTHIHSDYEYTHPFNSSILAMILAKSQGFSGKIICEEIGLGAFLRDIGMVNIPKEIIYKEGKLSAEESRLVREHTKDGFEYLKQFKNISDTSLRIVLHHHERFDGKGYPDNLTDERIPLPVKIVSICDVYDALISKRTYHQNTYTSREAMSLIQKTSKSFFNPLLITNFIKYVTPFVQIESMMPVGSMVILNTNEVGRVLEISSIGDIRPLIEILVNKDGKKLHIPFEVDLKIDISRKVETIMPQNSLETEY